MGASPLPSSPAQPVQQLAAGSQVQQQVRQGPMTRSQAQLSSSQPSTQDSQQPPSSQYPSARRTGPQGATSRQQAQAGPSQAAPVSSLASPGENEMLQDPRPSHSQDWGAVSADAPEADMPDTHVSDSLPLEQPEGTQRGSAPRVSPPVDAEGSLYYTPDNPVAPLDDTQMVDIVSFTQPPQPGSQAAAGGTQDLPINLDPPRAQPQGQQAAHDQHMQSPPASQTPSRPAAQAPSGQGAGWPSPSQRAAAPASTSRAGHAPSTGTPGSHASQPQPRRHSSTLSPAQQAQQAQQAADPGTHSPSGSQRPSRPAGGPGGARRQLDLVSPEPPGSGPRPAARASHPALSRPVFSPPSRPRQPSRSGLSRHPAGSLPAGSLQSPGGPSGRLASPAHRQPAGAEDEHVSRAPAVQGGHGMVCVCVCERECGWECCGAAGQQP